jgi:hypothetical protein
MYSHHPYINISLTPETSKFDWGLNLQEKTKLVWPLNSTNASPVSALHNRRVLSSLAVAMYDAVGDHDTSDVPCSAIKFIKEYYHRKSGGNRTEEAL